MTDRGNDLALVEAALFLSPQPLTRRGLAKILGGVRLAYVDQLLEDLAAAYEDSKRGIELRVDEGKALLRVKSDYVDRVAHLAPQQDIPRPILRTLAVIAYNHPMMQADLVRVRGNKAYGHVQELIDRGLIRSEAQGRTMLLQVTAEFLHHFGLSTVEEFRFHTVSLEAETPEQVTSAEEEDASEADGSESEDLADTQEPLPGQDISTSQDASPADDATASEDADAASEREDSVGEEDTSSDEVEDSSDEEADSSDEGENSSGEEDVQSQETGGA